MSTPARPQARDGSEGETGFGYWLCNITAVNDDASIVVPTYSELFSHTAGVTSENEKILNVVEQVAPLCAPDHILLFDRGGDRLELFQSHLQADRQFIVRQERLHVGASRRRTSG